MSQLTSNQPSAGSPLTAALRDTPLPLGPDAGSADVAVFWAGTGELVLELARVLPAVRVIGLDESGRDIARARRLIEAHGIAERVLLARLDPLHAVHARYPLVVVAEPLSRAADPLGAIMAGARATASRGVCIVLEPGQTAHALRGTLRRAFAAARVSFRSGFRVEAQRAGILVLRALDKA